MTLQVQTYAIGIEEMFLEFLHMCRNSEKKRVGVCAYFRENE